MAAVVALVRAIAQVLAYSIKKIMPAPAEGEVRFLERNRRNFFLFAVLIVLTLTTFMRGAFAFSGCAPGTEAGGVRLLCAENLSRRPAALSDRGRQYLSAGRVHKQKPSAMDNVFPEPEDPGKTAFGRDATSAPDERILYLSRVFVTERFLREQSLESVNAKPELVFVTKVPAGAFLKFEVDPPAILLLPTQIAVRK